MLKLAWKGLYELTLINIVATAVLIGIWPEPTTGQLWIMAAVNWPIAIISIWAVSKLLGTSNYDDTTPDPDAPAYPVAFEEIPASAVHVSDPSLGSPGDAQVQQGGD